MQLYKIDIVGSVQGVGFRPFIYRLAKELQLKGTIQNSTEGVTIEVEGEQNKIEEFFDRIQSEKPFISSIHHLEYTVHDIVGFSEFEIIHSSINGKSTATILPDITTCPDCLNELFDKTNRRSRYPLINCTNCGPRFSIVNAIPYDRHNTTMKKFIMCPVCQREYDDENDRRFHAQPNACPVCGPHLELWNISGDIIAKYDEALIQAADALLEGKILALKSIGGFQLLADARNGNTIKQLRERKRRNEKPFAVLYPSLTAIKRDCDVSFLEEKLLLSTSAPIVLLEKKSKNNITENSAPGNPNLGAMLPFSPLHHLLMADLNFPVVATSGNLHNEPICIDEFEALERLKGIADVFLVHNRPIARHIDDSVVRVIAGREQVIRRARGYAPLPIHLKHETPQLIAFGAHLKNAVAISTGKKVIMSQHIGDLETAQAFDAHKKVIADFKKLYNIDNAQLICDLHPDYLSTKYARQLSSSVITVQHHYAHVLSCMADNEVEDNVLGVCWDGTGYGTDGNIWGSEFLLTTANSFERVAHFQYFPLPGGDKSVKQPRRTALGLLYSIYGENIFHKTDLLPLQSFSASELVILRRMLKNELNAPLTCSAGRLFDAVASIIGLRQDVNFEGQAAMELEFLCNENVKEFYSFSVKEQMHYVINWQQLIAEILIDVKRNVDKSIIATKFHNTLVEMITVICQRTGKKNVVLTGGCFQNKYLTEKAILRLIEEGFNPYWHQRIPCNDGGIVLGQIMAVARLKQTNANKKDNKISSLTIK